MRHTLTAVLLLAAVSVQAADLKIAVIDPIKAISGTDQYKKAIADLEKQVAGDKAKATRLQGELNTCKQKMAKDAATMSATEVSKLRTDCEAKYSEYQVLGQKLTKIVSEREQAVLADIGPKLQAAVDALVKEGGYDMVVQREALLFVKPEFDISAKVTAKMNLGK